RIGWTTASGSTTSASQAARVVLNPYSVGRFARTPTNIASPSAISGVERAQGRPGSPAARLLLSAASRERGPSERSPSPSLLLTGCSLDLPDPGPSVSSEPAHCPRWAV